MKRDIDRRAIREKLNDLTDIKERVKFRIERILKTLRSKKEFDKIEVLERFLRELRRLDFLIKEIYSLSSQSLVISLERIIESLKTLEQEFFPNFLLKKYSSQVNDWERATTSELKMSIRKVQRDMLNLERIIRIENQNQNQIFLNEKREESNILTKRLKKGIEELERNEKYFKELEKKHKLIKEEIEENLKGSRTVGLTRTFLALKKEANINSWIWTAIFFIATGAISGLTLYFILKSKEYPLTNTIELFLRISLILPLIWIATFASRRRSEENSLKREYAHKESLGLTYLDYKNEIDISKLGTKKEELLGNLLEETVLAISFNPRTILDKNHKESTPYDKVVEIVLGILKIKKKRKESFKKERIEKLIKEVLKELEDRIE